MARVKKFNTDQFDSGDLELNDTGAPDVYSAVEDASNLSSVSEAPIPAESSIPAPEILGAPSPAKAAVAKVYQAGDEYFSGGKKGKVIVVLKDLLKVRWADSSIGFVKK